MNKKKLIVMKFGGTSVGNAERILNVANIVKKNMANGNRIIVVVSAVSTATDLLIKSAQSAKLRDRLELDAQYSDLYKLHLTIIKELKLQKKAEEMLVQDIDLYFAELKNLLDSNFVLGELSERGLDLISSYGERMSIHLVTAALEKLGINAQAVEATKLIITDEEFVNAKPLLPESEQATKKVLQKIIDKNIIPVVTGFIGSTLSGETTTLGRSGSDYSATILGYCLDAAEVWIWTDVNGVMTADPRIIPDAKTLPVISYNEAAELSYFGAKVIHPLTILPIALKNIPVRIKNTFNPDFAGTEIIRDKQPNGEGIRAVTSIKNLSLITFEGKGLMGVSGVISKLFSAISQHNIDIILISQASSDHNITFVVKRTDSQKTIAAIKQAFEVEFLYKLIDKVKAEDNIAVIAVIGEGMRNKTGVAGKLFTAIGKKNISIMSIAQGSSELNISLVIKEDQVIDAIRSIHQEFGLGK